jgi:hypothetical protein
LIIIVLILVSIKNQIYMYSSSASYFTWPLLNKLVTISSRVGRRFIFYVGIKLSNFVWILYLIFLFFDAFLSTFLLLLIFDLFYKYYNVLLTKKLLSLSSYCSYIFWIYWRRSTSSYILISVVLFKFYYGSNRIFKGARFCWHFLLTFGQS